MELDVTAINEFKELYLKKYGIKLSNQQAMDYGIRLIGLVKAVYGNNLPRVKFDKGVEKHNN